MPETEQNIDHPMDEDMSDADAEQIGPLWIRRQVFEHSVAVPLLTTSSASQIDFPRLAEELRAATINTDSDTPPSVSYEAWVAAAGLHARLDSSEDAGIIIEALETNAPDAFVRCNDPAKLAPGRQLPYRQLFIPVPELLAFIKLHAAATISSRFRETADAVWVESGDAPLLNSPPVINANSGFASQSQGSARSGSPQMTSTPVTNGNSALRSPSRTQTDEGIRSRSPNHSADPSTLSGHMGSMGSPASPMARGREQPFADTATPPALSHTNNPSEQQNHMKDQNSEVVNPSENHPDNQVNSSTRLAPDMMQDLTINTGKQTSRDPQPEPIEGFNQKLSQTPMHNLTLNTQAVQSPTYSQGTPPPTSPGIDGIVRKKTPTHLGAMIQSQSAILASDNHAFQRETRLVVSNLKSLLLIIASAYGVGSDDVVSQTELISPESGVVMGGGTVAAESGSLARETFLSKPRRSNSIGSSTDSIMSDDHIKSTKNLLITRQMFEHLSFLLTTTCNPSGSYRPLSYIVPQWRDPESTNSIPLGELVDILTASLTRVTLTGNFEGSTDVAEIRDLDRKTILRSNIPTVNASATQYPHGKEIRISNCNESHFYLTCTLGRVSLIACKDCTVFVGACVSISVINCVNVSVHAISRVCRVTNSLDTHLYICTNRNPQIVGENHGLVFAPYNAACNREAAAQYLAALGIDAKANIWDKFYRPAYRSLSTRDRKDPDLTPAVAKVLPPDQFLPFAVPLRQLGPSFTSSENVKHEQHIDLRQNREREATFRSLFGIPLPLPPEYEQKLAQRKQELDKIRREIRAFERKLAVQAMEEDNTMDGGGAVEKDTGMDKETAGGNESRMNVQSETQGRTPIEKEQEMREEPTERESAEKDVAMTDQVGTSSPKNESDEQDNSSSVTRKGVLQALVHERFREWLNHSGRMKQIHDLVRLDQEA